MPLVWDVLRWGTMVLAKWGVPVQGFRVAVAARIQVPLGTARGVFSLGRCPSFGQIVTSAFGEKHTPYGVLFIANDYLVFPVIYMEKGSNGRLVVAANSG